jgi:hypothetical protein
MPNYLSKFIRIEVKKNEIFAKFSINNSFNYD